MEAFIIAALGALYVGIGAVAFVIAAERDQRKDKGFKA